MAVDKYGNVYATGGSIGVGTEWDFATVKYNSAGILQWIARYDGPLHSWDVAAAIAVDDSGNFFVAGTSVDLGSISVLATIKYNAAGETVWVRKYDREGHGSEAKGIALDRLGNICVTGCYYGAGTGANYLTIKYSQAGETLWVRTYNGEFNDDDEPTAIDVDSAGNVYVGGSSYDYQPAYDFLMIKYSPTGETLWVRRTPRPQRSFEWACAMAVDSAGNAVLTGSTVVPGNRDWFTVKYNPLGDTTWTEQYVNPPYYDEACDVELDERGYVYVTGEAADTFDNPNIRTVKYSPTGETVWVRDYDGTLHSDDHGRGITLDKIGNVYVTGSTMDSVSHWQNWITLKYDPQGELRWLTTYNGLGDRSDEARFIAVDTSGDVIVAGVSWVFGAESDYTIIKYQQIVNVEEGGGNLSARPLLTVSPNPFRDRTVIRCAVPGQGSVSLKIYDVTGRVVATVKNKVEAAGVYNLQWDAKNMANGVYFVELEAGTYLNRKKVVLVR